MITEWATEQKNDSSSDPVKPDGGIFINYRQCDARGRRRCHAMFVEALSHLLAHHFGDKKVFIDRETRPGTEYPKELREKLAACEVLLVVIHAEWLTDLNDPRRTGKDWVRYEIVTGLERKRHREVEVIPVLLDEALLPQRGDLPEKVQGLLLMQTVRLRSGSLPGDLTRLIAELEAHVRPSWSAPETGPENVTKPPATSISAACRWALTAFVLSLVLGFVSTGSAPENVFAVSIFSLIFIAALMLIMGLVNLSRKPIYKIERELFAEPAGRYLLFSLILALGTIMVMLVIWGQPASDTTGQVQSMVLVLVFVAALFGVGVAAVRQDRADRQWPPKPSTWPGPLRRTVARLHERLTSLWRPPLSRLQRDQACVVFDQLIKVVETMEEEGARSRRNWLLSDHPRKVLGYSAWVAGTIGLAVGALLASIARSDANLMFVVLPVLIAVAGGALSLTTIEFGFRSQRKHRNWLIEDIKKDLEDIKRSWKQLHPESADLPAVTANLDRRPRDNR